MSDSKFILGGDVFNFIQLKQLDRYMIGHKGYVAGGVFKNIFNNESYKDLDVSLKINLTLLKLKNTLKATVNMNLCTEIKMQYHFEIKKQESEWN